MRRLPKGVIYGLGALPALWLAISAYNADLGADPVKTLEHTLGLWALRFLLASLAVTPLRRLGGPNLIRFRRALGLLAFFYALLHLSVYAVLDQALNWAAVLADIAKRPYLTLGMLAFVILFALAITSNNAMIRRLGSQRWQRLHRLAYLAVAAGAAHFLMSVKSLAAEPVFYAGIAGGLLVMRLVLFTSKLTARATASPPQATPPAATPYRR